MATEEIRYTIPADSNDNHGSRADLVFTYDPTTQNPDGSYAATGASGTYQILDFDGAIVAAHSVTGLAPAGTLGNNDNHLFLVGDPAANPAVTNYGITFTIDSSDDSNDGNGNVNLYDAYGPSDGSIPHDTPAYREDGANTNDATSASSGVVCFAAGTRIRTTRGNIAVEALEIGDRAVTASGRHQRICWLGQRTMDFGASPASTSASPIRIRADAFGPNRPERTLRLSPGHPVLVGANDEGEGGALVPIMCLVNGTSIARERVEHVTYWHVELDNHDILLAEGLPAESYLDWGDRRWFGPDAETHALANPDFVAPGLDKRCRPVAIDGQLVERERHRLDTLFAEHLCAQCQWPTKDNAQAI